MGRLRVFVAVAPPDEVRQDIAAQLADVKIPGRVVPPPNWHITLRFLDEIDEVTRDRYFAELDSRDLGRRFKMTLGGLGAFPNHRKATVTWLGVTLGEVRLFQMAETTDEAAAAIGLQPEERPFSPHLTLSRVRPPESVTGLIESTELEVTWRVDHIVVFRSLNVRGGVRYEPIERFELVR